MSSTSETETEILLGNRHLLAIFFVLAILLGIAFTGGYMVGRNSSDKRPTAPSASGSDPAASPVASSIETHVVSPASDQPEQAPSGAQTADPPVPAQVQAPTETASPLDKEKPPLGSDRKDLAKHAESIRSRTEPSGGSVPPQSGQIFLQVAAVDQTSANALAGVLSKKGFRAQAVLKPGTSVIYRVLIGPVRDRSDESTTRESLRNAGFTQIIRQRY